MSPAEDAPGADPTPASGAAALLRQRDFGLWFAGNLANNSGTWLYNVAAAVVVYDLTRSALQVGLVTMAQYLPLVLLAPWAGALSDRLDRRRMILCSQGVAALSAGALAVTVAVTGVANLPGAWPIVLTSAGIGLGMAFAIPPMNALVPALVHDRDLDVAVTLTSLTFNLGRAFGPATAGIVLVTLGAEMAFVTNALTFVAMIVALALLRPRPSAVAARGQRSIRAGLTYVWRDPVVLRLLVGVGAIGFAADPLNTLAPPLAEAAGGDGRLVAALVSAFGVTAGLSALASARVYRRAGVAATGRGGCLVFAGGLALAALAPAPPVALVAFAVMGAGYLLGLNSFTAMLQRRVPDQLRGRVMALWSVAFLGTRPLAALVDGTVADLVGVRPAFAVPVAMALAAAAVTRGIAPTRAPAAPSP